MFVEETPSFGYHDRSPSKSKWWTLWHHCSELLVENSDNVLAKEDCLWSCGCDRGCWLWFQLESVYCRFLARSRPGRRLNMSLQLFSFYEPLVSLETYCPRNWWISFFFRLIKGCCMTIYRYGMFLEIEKFLIILQHQLLVSHHQWVFYQIFYEDIPIHPSHQTSTISIKLLHVIAGIPRD